MKRIFIAAVAALLVAAHSAPAGAQAAKLKVGSPAPPIKVVAWSKGTPVTTFAPGKVYVVEFWATWCGPCRTTIPHLTELAKQHKSKVTFVGVSVFERGADAKGQVAAFVKEMGAKMDYNVAVDGPEGTMGKTWMEAAAQQGIPTAFVVGKKGTIEWIGHPMAGLDKVLDQVVAGTFDPKVAAAAAEKERAAQARMRTAVQPIIPLAQAGKFAEALVALEKVLAANPDLEAAGLWNAKFSFLLQTDDAAASLYAKKAGETFCKDEAEQLNMLSWTLIDPMRVAKAPDYKIALALAQRAALLTKHENAAIMDTLAYAYFKTGDKAKAIELGVKAQALATKAGDPSDEYARHLAEYRK